MLVSCDGAENNNLCFFIWEIPKSTRITSDAASSCSESKFVKLNKRIRVRVRVRLQVA